MSIRFELQAPGDTLQILKRCFMFVRHEWPHATRDSLPDEGFEQRLRESCIRSLRNWSISGEREMYLGAGFETASGVLHEIDIVARRPESTAIIEMKNRKSAPPTKNDVIVFFAKIIDYLAANAALIDNDVCLVFVSSGPFEPTGLAACMGLGIHPVGPDIRPLPILVRNAIIMESEIRRGLRVPAETQDRFEDMCARLNNLSSTLRDTWLDSRCGHVSEDKIVLKAVAPLRTIALAQEMWQLNADCADLLDRFRAAKSVK